MKTIIKKTSYPLTASEKRSAKFLMEKMGISKKELKEISNMYGVSFTKIVELMQLSKYEYVVKDELIGRCELCKLGPGKIDVTKFW
jgi:hypothetical protein